MACPCTPIRGPFGKTLGARRMAAPLFRLLYMRFVMQRLEALAVLASGVVLVSCNYVVTVRKPGYRDWIQSVVQVRDTCSLETKRFTARLERSP